MAKDFYVVYPANTAASDPDYIVGKAQNESWDGAKDWFPLEATWVNELLGFWSALLDAAGFTPDGNAENISASQYLDAINALPVILDRLGEGDIQLNDSSLRFGLSTDGYVSMGASAPLSQGYVQTSSGNTKTYTNRMRMLDGGLRFDVNSGTQHNMHSVLVAIAETDVTFVTGTPNYIQLAGLDLSPLLFSEVWRTNLIMKSSSNIQTVPLNCIYFNNTTLQLDYGWCVTPPGFVTDPTAYDDHYLQIWLDPDSIP